jgi:hypothetical protein
VNKNPKVVDVEAIRHAMTEKAILISLDGEKEDAVWLPLSRCEVEEKGGRKVSLQVEYDLAFEKGLI